jgi:hypothetical protein
VEEKLIVNLGHEAAVNGHTIAAAISTDRKEAMWTTRLAQGLVDVPENVVQIFQTDRDPD